MIEIAGLLSFRNVGNEICRQVVFEWEDAIVDEFGLVLKCVDNCAFYGKKKLSFGQRGKRFFLSLRKFHDLNKNEPVYLAFVGFPREIIFVQNYNCIPVFLDVWNYDINYLKRKMKVDSLFFVTSLDVYYKLKKIGFYKVEYMPLTIANKWYKRIPTIDEKKYDIIQIGRRNPILHEYAIKYVKKYPEVEYVYADIGGTLGSLKYFSTKNSSVQELITRESYMNMLKESLICLVSSPGIDDSKPEAEDIDFPTPRFYESVASYCYLIGRYTNHEEFQMQGIQDVCINISSYEKFEKEVSRILKERCLPDSRLYSEFNDSHGTSEWFKKIIKKINKDE